MREGKAWVSQIQHGSVGDGPGLRTTVFLSGCPLRCGWCHNPETWEQWPRLMFFSSLCVQCGVCAEICPQQVHLLEGKHHAVRREGCLLKNGTECGECASLCPQQAIRLTSRAMTLEQVMEEILQDRDFYASSGRRGDPFRRGTSFAAGFLS